MNPQNPSQPPPPFGTAQPENSSDRSGSVSGAKQKVAEAARGTADQVKSSASDTLSRVKGQAIDLVGDRKRQAADRLGRVSSAIHDSANTVEDEDPNIAYYTHRIADRLDSVAEYVRNHDFKGLMEDASGIARRHPTAFLGGVFVAGLLLGNMVKASAPTGATRDYPSSDFEPSLPDGTMLASSSSGSNQSSPTLGSQYGAY